MVPIRSLVFCLAAALGAGGCVSGSVVADGNGGPSSTSGGGAGGTIVRNGSAKCLGVKAGATADGSSADQYTCNGTAAQNWALQPTATAGQVTLRNVNASRCLDVKSNATADGTTIQLYDCNGTSAQVWAVEDQGNGYAQLRNPHSNKCVDVAGGSDADSALVQLYDCNGTAAQQWKINGVTTGTAGGSGASGGGGGAAGGGGGAAGGGVATGTFVHPGVLVDKAQLDFVKAQIAAKKDPWYTAFNAAKGSALASLSYTPSPFADVECGPTSMNPDVGCQQEKDDAAAAYTQALLWYYTGNTTYAQNAIKIMNAWSYLLTKHGASNAPLQSAWAASQWPRAGEIIKYTYSGWAPADATQFGAMLKNVYSPETINGSDSNGNWELAMIEANIGIAVYLDDHVGFDSAVAMWKKRVPAYVYLTSDGATPVRPETNPSQSASALNGFWYDAPAYLNGMAQETCRDLGHVQYGLASMTNAAETARIQGIDLYSLEKTRLAAGYEFHAQYLNGATANTTSICGSHALVSVSADAMWEIGYNALNGRLGLALPQTQALIGQIRPTWQDHMMAWETLTHAQTGSVGVP